MSMYLAGICPGDNEKPGCWMMVEKFYRNVRHHYAPRAAGFEDVDLWKKAGELYFNPSFIRIKKVFSQDGRPARFVTAHPLLVILLRKNLPDQSARLKELRQKGVWFVSVAPAAGAEMGTHGQAGRVEHRQVSAARLVEALFRVYKEDRLVLDNSFPYSEELDEFLKTLPKNSLRPEDLFNHPLAAACALAVWYRETVKGTTKGFLHGNN